MEWMIAFFIGFLSAALPGIILLIVMNTTITKLSDEITNKIKKILGRADR